MKSTIFHAARALGIGLALFAFGVQPGRAQTTFTYTGDLIDTDDGDYVSTDSGASYFTTFAGRYKGQFGDGPVVNLFCVDATHDASALPITYQVDASHTLTAGIGALNAGGYYNGGLSSALTTSDYLTGTRPPDAEKAIRSSEVSFLSDTYLNATEATFSSDPLSSSDLITNLAAVNLSVWDIAQDGGDGLHLGTFLGDSATQTTYDALVTHFESLAAAQSNYPSPYSLWIQAPRDANGHHMQDFVFDPRAAVPEPGGLAVFLVCAGALGVCRVKRSPPAPDNGGGSPGRA